MVQRPTHSFSGFVNRQLVITIAVIIGSLVALFFFTGSPTGGSVLLADASAVANDPADFQNRELRVRGFVKPGSIVRYGEKADFIIELDGSELPVHFDGSTQLPDTFQDAAAVRADGRLTNGKLVSTKVEAKCTSKYDTEHVDELKKKQYGQQVYGGGGEPK